MSTFFKTLAAFLFVVLFGNKLNAQIINDSINYRVDWIGMELSAQNFGRIGTHLKVVPDVNGIGTYTVPSSGIFSIDRCNLTPALTTDQAFTTTLFSSLNRAKTLKLDLSVRQYGKQAANSLCSYQTNDLEFLAKALLTDPFTFGKDSIYRDTTLAAYGGIKIREFKRFTYGASIDSALEFSPFIDKVQQVHVNNNSNSPVVSGSIYSFGYRKTYNSQASSPQVYYSFKVLNYIRMY